MKKNLRSLFAGAFALLAAGFAQNAEASHYQGSELIYTCVAPGMYVVDLKLYRDCSGITAPTTASLNLKSTNCNNGRSVVMTKVGPTRIGNPYCSQISPGCSATGLTNYEEVTFTTTVTFTAAEQACPEWLLSWTECCRPETVNLLNASGASLYTEAMVRLGGNINNNSPIFGSLVVPYVNHSQPILLSSFAIDPDGDSLVYSLKDPLNAPNATIPFSSYATFLAYNSDSTKYTIIPGGNFSKTYPIISYAIDWSLPMPITPIQKFMFDTRTGSIGFIPNKYIPNSVSALGLNKYVMVVQVDEYRKTGGAVVKVGTVRRDMYVTVIDCGPNQNPNITAPVANGQPIPEGGIINLRPGTPMNFQFAASDGNANDVLTITSDIAQILPGATLTLSVGNQPTGTINYTPTPADVRNQVYYFHVNVMDNACPVKGVQTHTFGVKVSATGGVTGINDKGLALQKFIAYPNPFTETVSFKLQVNAGADQHLVIYNTLGQQVDRITLKGFAAGEQTVTWKNASKMANGQYIAKLISNQKEVQTIQFSKMQ